MNYKSRSIRQSVKNFQIFSKINSTDEDLIMQFGRTNDDTYVMDFKFPFSPLQAFAIALSSIDGKFACE